MDQHFEIVIIGAGPAGITAAIRLLQLGHSVALVEQDPFPRPQIGESLSPGVQHIFTYLHAGHLLDDHRYLRDIPAQVCWAAGEPTILEASERGPGIVVDRGNLDQQMLAFAAGRGLYVFQPAKFISSIFKSGLWELTIQSGTGIQALFTQVVLDARGRKVPDRPKRIEIAPASIAVWTHVPASMMPSETRIEAIDEGWLWGSPVPGDRYRLMAFADAESVKGKDLAVTFLRMLSKGQLFESTVEKNSDLRVQTCAVNAYVHAQPWQQQFIKVGEAAFTLDPLSSTGVELAMRFSLQTAMAVHTLLRYQEPEVAQAFYESKLTDAVANHTHWTAAYYAQSGKANKPFPFWEKRKNFQPGASAASDNFTRLLYDKLNQSPNASETHQMPSLPIDSLIRFLWDKPVRLSCELTYCSEFAVTGNRVERKPALSHPNLPRPVIYLGRIELPPLLTSLHSGMTYGAAIGQWSRQNAFEDVKKAVTFLWGAGVFVEGD